MNSIADAIKIIRDNLYGIVDNNEARHYAWLIFYHLRKYSQTDMLLKGGELLTKEEISFINSAINRLKQSEPIQYVLGVTEFMGFTFKVDKRVLIPRPETEELVEWILRVISKPDINILDIGTGSGVIPVSIKKLRPETNVFAWDISEDALIVAKENALLNSVDINFKRVDILQYQADKHLFDIIVSNPPYVTYGEKSQMLKNVLDFEPHTALFVPDNDSLLFYRAIAKFSLESLKPGGVLYFEINETFGNETVELLKSYGFVSIELKKDISEKDRMIKAYIAES